MTDGAAAPTSKQVGSYFAQWGVYGRDYQVADIVSSGSADKLTFINYAFGNIYAKNGGYECGIVNKAESGDGTGGDAWADFGRTPNRRVDPSDTIKWDDKLAGNFRELKALKAKYPNVKVFISLGGWSWSKYFSAAAKTDALRKQLVASCIDTYIKGNLPVIDGRGGEAAAAGVFDGIDIDWEFVGVQGIGYNTVDPVNDKANHVLLMQEFRKQLDALSASTGKPYLLTEAIGIGYDKIGATDPGAYIKSLNWLNLMSYDYQGGWDAQGPTDHQANLYDDPASPRYGKAGYVSTDGAVKALAAAGVPKNKMVVGIPFYGRGWTGVTNANNGLYQKSSDAATGTYEKGIEDYKVIKNRAGTVYYQGSQSYKYDGSTFWTYDTPQTIATKVKYVKDNGMAGVMSWELSGDTSTGELMTEMNKVKQ